ncbi:MAG: prolyl-tRNA synthetase associated domain-containing protein [Chitinophagales bacterium]
MENNNTKNQQTTVLNILADLEIDYILHEHEAVFTIAQSEKHWDKMEGKHCKNLFLRGRKGKQHYLVVLQHDKKISLKVLGRFVGNQRLSFASPTRLERYLGVKAGSVSPFGLINDSENHVIVLIDKDLQTAEKVNFHPNVNTASLTMNFADFEKYLKWTKNAYQLIDA